MPRCYKQPWDPLNRPNEWQAPYRAEQIAATVLCQCMGSIQDTLQIGFLLAIPQDMTESGHDLHLSKALDAICMDKLYAESTHR